jgi:hypothetical protein
LLKQPDKQKAPKPTPEEAKRQALERQERSEERQANSELIRERAEAVRTARMKDQLLLVKAS